MPSRRPNYGVDAPWITFGFLFGGLALCILEFVQNAVHGLIWPGVSFGLTGAFMLFGSKLGKQRMRDKVLSQIPGRPLRILDIGCGHGLFLIGAAKHFPDAKVVGIDLWRNVDQAFNSREATLENARIEGVEQRVELVEGDARSLPFEDHSFDLVLSSYAIHNIPDAAGREKAIREAMRVLKPEGRMEIVDIMRCKEYESVLKSEGWNVSRSLLEWFFIMSTYWVRATPGENQPADESSTAH